jgi:hypothetical protein
MRNVVLVIAVVAAALVAAAPSWAASTVLVTSNANAGPGTLRAAVEKANGDAGVRTILIRPGLGTITLTEPVVYTGGQDLTLDGSGETVSGAGGDTTAPANRTWGGGLFVSNSAADLTLLRTRFTDSFNNGVAVLVPGGATGAVSVRLLDVRISGSQFHGLFVDGQSSSGYNTDDEPHASCSDPHPFDSAASVEVRIQSSTITGSGDLDPGYDDSLATGCPRDFDGLRVDDGGEGGIDATLLASSFDGNLADGVELDESGNGNVVTSVVGSSFDENGDSGATIDGITDPDDGFDIDEAGEGSVDARLVNARVRSNLDEGLDFDEAGAGSVELRLVNTRSTDNTDENVKVDEEDAGDVVVTMTNVVIANSEDEEGVQLTETGDGNVDVRVVNTSSTGNDKESFQVDQEDAGAGIARFVNVTFDSMPKVSASGVTVIPASLAS